MASKKKTRSGRSNRSGSRDESLEAGTARKRTASTSSRAKHPGRPPIPGSRLRHIARPKLDARFPVHVSWHVEDDVPNLRAPQLMSAIRRAFIGGKERFGFRLVHFNVQDNHVHLLCEAESNEALSRGMQGLAVRVAKAINKVLGRKGRLFDDRHNWRILKTPSEVHWALGYVLNNTRRHNAELLTPKSYPRHWLDLTCSSADYFPGWKDREECRLPGPDCPVVEPKTWLLRVGWQKAGEIAIDHVPAPREG